MRMKRPKRFSLYHLLKCYPLRATLPLARGARIFPLCRRIRKTPPPCQPASSAFLLVACGSRTASVRLFNTSMSSACGHAPPSAQTALCSLVLVNSATSSGLYSTRPATFAGFSKPFFSYSHKVFSDTRRISDVSLRVSIFGERSFLLSVRASRMESAMLARSSAAHWRNASFSSEAEITICTFPPNFANSSSFMSKSFFAARGESDSHLSLFASLLLIPSLA